MSIKKRKIDHVEITAGEDVTYRKTTGLEQFDFIHNAIPEVNPEEVSTRASLLGREFSFPLFISSMTGGYMEAGSVNAMIAEFCERNNLPFGVGSQRIMLENPEEESSFAVVREKAPNAFIAANIGGAQLVGGLEKQLIEKLIQSIRADAVIVHLNPLQELVQPEGDHNFEGIEEGIAHLITNCDLPVIVKETGAGISSEVAQRLLAIGVHVIDISGAGGTSWSRVENLRKDPDAEFDPFDEWGIPTAVCIREVNKLRDRFRFEMIASGGIRTSFDMMKSIALGSDFTAAALPVIRALKEGGTDLLQNRFDTWKKESRMILTLIGCRSLKELLPSHLRKL